MLDLSSAPIVLDLETVFPRVQIGITGNAVGKGKIVAVVLQNPLTNIDNPTTANALTVRYGDAAGMTGQLLPGTTSPILYFSDLEQCYARVEGAVGGIDTLYLTLIVYKKRKQKR